jgi:hypothetical protein
MGRIHGKWSDCIAALMEQFRRPAPSNQVNCSLLHCPERVSLRGFDKKMVRAAAVGKYAAAEYASSKEE